MAVTSSTEALAEHLVDILDRICADRDLIEEIRSRSDLNYPDLRCAQVEAQIIRDHLRDPG